MLGSDRTAKEEDISSSPFDTSSPASVVINSLLNNTTNSINQNNDEMISKLILQQAALFQQQQQSNNLITSSSQTTLSQQQQPSSPTTKFVSDTTTSNNHSAMIHDCFFTPNTATTTTTTPCGMINSNINSMDHTLFSSAVGGEMTSNFDSFLMSLSNPSNSAEQLNTSNNLSSNNLNSDQLLFSSANIGQEQQQHQQQQQHGGLLPNNHTTLSADDAMMISEAFTSSGYLQPTTDGTSIITEKRDNNQQHLNFVGSVGGSASSSAESNLMQSSTLEQQQQQQIIDNSGSLHSYLTQSNVVNNNNNCTSSSSGNNVTCNNNSQQMEVSQTNNQQDESPSPKLHPIACTRCRERHKRCDRKLPNCSYCEKQCLPCVYTTPKKQRRVYQRAVPVPAGNDVSSITMVTGGGSSGSFFTSSRTPIANPGGLNLLAPRRGSVDSTFSNISTTTSGGISTTSSTAGTTNSGSSGNEVETANAFEIFTFRWQGGSGSQNQKSEKKRKSSNESSSSQKKSSVTKSSPSKPNKSNAAQSNDNSSLQQETFENYSFPKKAKKSKKTAPQSSNQHAMIDNQTANNNNNFNHDNQPIYFNNNPNNNMNAINSSLSSIISQGLLMNQQKDITQDHINMLGTSNPNVPTMLLNLDNNMMFGNQNMSYNPNQNIVMNASVFRKSYFDFYFRYISLGYSWIPQEVFDSVLFGTEAMSSVFGNDIMSLLYAIHAITALVMGNSVEAEMAYHKSELLLPPLPDNSLTSLLNNGSLTINSAHSVARNLVLAHYLLSIGSLTSSKRYLRLADGVLSKYSPNYMSQAFINCIASSDEEDAGGLTHENSIFAKVPNQIMLLMKYRIYVGFKFDETQFIMERGLDYVNGLVNFTQPVHARNQPLNSICLPEDSTISFRSFVGMSMLTSYLHATGTIPNEIITITTQPLSSENIKIYLTLSLLLRKKIKGQTKARLQLYSGNQEAVLASPLSLLIDLFSLSCSILMLHETMCNQGLYQSSNTDQLQYTSVMFQYADQMKDIITQIPTESVDVSYLYLGILYLLVMYFKQLEEIENQAISKGFSLHNNDIFHKQLASLSIVHKFVAVITNKYPVVMEKYKSTVERIGLFLNKYQIMNYQ